MWPAASAAVVSGPESVQSSLSWVHLFWTLPPKFFSIRSGRIRGSGGIWASADYGVESGVCAEPSVLGTFVLDSPSKVLFSSFLGAHWGVSGCGVGSVCPESVRMRL